MAEMAESAIATLTLENTKQKSRIRNQDRNLVEKEKTIQRLERQVRDLAQEIRRKDLKIAELMSGLAVAE